MIKYVFLDAGATLIHVNPSPASVYREIFLNHGFDHSEARLAGIFRKVWLESAKHSRRGRNRYDAFPGGEEEFWVRFVESILKYLGTEDADATAITRDLRAVFVKPEAWKAFPEVPDVLARLRDEGYYLGIISNWDSKLPALLDDLGLTPSLDLIVTSTTVGYEKPSAKIFREALKGAGAHPWESVHVGDDPDDDYMGAQNAGLTPILVNRDDRKSSDDNGYRAVRSLSELPELLKKLG